MVPVVTKALLWPVLWVVPKATGTVVAHILRDSCSNKGTVVACTLGGSYSDRDTVVAHSGWFL